MKVNNFNQLYIQQLKDLYSAERQMIEALPKTIKKAQNAKLRSALKAHLEETKKQRDRIEKIFKKLDRKPGGHLCKAMKGLIDEAAEALDTDIDETLRDAAIIASAQRIEHYEISAYGTACEFAKELGRDDDAKLLQKSLDEESMANHNLNKIATGTVNQKARKAG